MEKMEERRSWGRLRCAPPWGFSDSEDERLYGAYTQRQRQRAVPRVLAVGALLQVWAALVPGERDLYAAYACTAVAFALDLLLLALFYCMQRLRSALAHAAWLALWAQLLLAASRRVGDSYNELLGWAAVLQYLTLAALPFHYLLLLLYSCISVGAYVLVQYYNALTTENRLPIDFDYQEMGNFAVLVGTSLLGATAYAIAEQQQRCSFRETKRSLGDKLTIEQQSKEQERLLLSVLPEHVAVQMRKDLGLIDTQFKKIYMSRHENVSILYADIVGFTAISSTYSAQDLVAILNELFARFDRLAEKYHQLRIKILGDCYYCIAGAPVERPDHAVLCVHMGLSMVKAIKYVQQTTNSPVDMRVGIHTGAVLAGVLGQRQWQFDVYSRDVELANKMESSGKAGRVHISEVTKNYLNDEFEVEPAYGERREEMLRQAGIKTFFIVRVLKPFQGEALPAPEGEPGAAATAAEGAAGEASEPPDTLSDLRDDDEDSVLSPQDESKDTEELKIFNMLEEELVNRDDDKELADATTLCLTFKAAGEEAGWRRRLDAHPQATVAPPVLLLAPVVVLSSFAAPPGTAMNAVYVVLVLETSLLNFIYYAYQYSGLEKKTISPYWKLTCGVFNIAMFVAANIAPLIICGWFETALDDGLREDALAHSGARRCLHPSYYYHVGACAACGALWVSPLGGGGRAALLLALAAAHALPAALNPALLVPRAGIDHEPYSLLNQTDNALFQIIAPIHHGRHILMLFLIVIALLIFDRYSEALERARHSRGERMRAQAEQAADLRRRNQALIHNVLPPHVADHFMGARHHHRDLYSQSYAEVGVLFASMPNFSEFYSEETVNNQGLECLRFLNEVISDFDLLLEDAKFSKDIIKIKTISSTYMAASGLNPTRQMQPSDSVVVRWAHLACLVEFALELQRVLTAINEQSFNHFVLRLGVNHGPITAGVIGARKPHYDIWGNTVNVASRMESTGKAGCIQVTEETCEILQSFGYYFEQRGLVAVKGKGQLMTYYLQGKRDPPAVHTSPASDDQPTFQTGDKESHESSASDALLANGEASGAGGSARDAPQPADSERLLLMP